jgi:hypothetical protein
MMQPTTNKARQARRFKSRRMLAPSKFVPASFLLLFLSTEEVTTYVTHTHTYTLTEKEGRKADTWEGEKRNQKEFIKIDNKPGVCTMEQ